LKEVLKTTRFCTVLPSYIIQKKKTGKTSFNSLLFEKSIKSLTPSKEIAELGLPFLSSAKIKLERIPECSLTFKSYILLSKP